MRYLALACDYDGTLAHDGRVSSGTIAALEHLVASGRKLIMVTGRELQDLFSVFPRGDLFEWIVAENGCLLYDPASGESKPLADPPPAKFIAKLRERNVPVSVGQAIVSTWHPHENTVLDTIRELGLELQVIFNKGAVMVLPAGTSKATGLAAALKEMGLSPHNVIGVGDAENDHAFLTLCGCSVAVANALPMLKEQADFVTAGENGAGTSELIAEIVATDLREREAGLKRHNLLLGRREDGEEIRIRPFAANMLLAGSTGSGKSTVATSFLARLYKQRYQFCVVDSGGHYERLGGAVRLGNHERAPTADEVLRLLENPDENVVVNLAGVPLSDRPSFFLDLLARLLELRADTGRPHWIVVNAAQHVLPASRQPELLSMPQQLGGMLYITIHPKMVARVALTNVKALLAIGESPENSLKELGELLEEPAPVLGPTTLNPGETLVWFRDKADAPFKLKLVFEKSANTRISPRPNADEVPPT
ncbi:MAG: HAD-IIB family hydrolase [Deltaproteobacteria bacterium]|nr:HAD-IIB family hydrolase [Deltaproteobacteria bacterium]